MALTGKWALSIFGFISIPLIAVPFILYKFGPSLRAKSTYTRNPSIHSHMPLNGEMRMGSMEAEPYDAYRQ